MNIGKVGTKIAKYGIKAAGVLGAGICLYDAHKAGMHRSEIRANKYSVNAAIHYLDNSRRMNRPSAFNANMKDGLFNFEMKNDFRTAINAGIGYVSGFVGSLLGDVIPIGLSAAAIFTKGKIPASIAGGALGLYALVGFTKNVLGIGTHQSMGYNEKIS